MLLRENYKHCYILPSLEETLRYLSKNTYNFVTSDKHFREVVIYTREDGESSCHKAESRDCHVDPRHQMSGPTLPSGTDDLG